MSRKKIPLVVATTNAGKAREIRAALKDLPVKILTLKDFGLRPSFPEKGKTFEDNARGKSLYYSRQTEYLTLAEDSGLEIKVLGGAPGIYSARFSGRSATDEKNIRKVLGLMKTVPPEKRAAQFVCSMVLSQKSQIIKKVRGKVRGVILFEKRGRLGFGYDPIFYYRRLRKSFGELEAGGKNKISHRGRALRKIKEFLRTCLRDQLNSKDNI